MAKATSDVVSFLCIEFSWVERDDQFCADNTAAPQSYSVAEMQLNV
jgi:hypothetical protein